MQALLSSEREQLLAMQRQAAREEKPAAVAPSPVKIDAPRSQAKPASAVAVPVIAGFGVLAAALAAAFFRLRRRVPAPNAPFTQTISETTAGTNTDGGMLIAEAAVDSVRSPAERRAGAACIRRRPGGARPAHLRGR